MFLPNQIDALQAGKATNAPAIRTLAQAELPASLYASFVYDEYWLTGRATLDELVATLETASSDLGGPLCYFPHTTLAGRLAQTREFVAQRVPFIAEYGQHLTNRESRRPMEWLAYLTREIHKAEPEDIDYFLTEIAATLQHRIVVRTESKTFRITELEFYYHSRSHPDPYVHKGVEQRKHLHWYFNQASSLDLTLGDQETNSFGGIGLRGLELQDSTQTSYNTDAADALKYVSGPQLALRALISSWGSAMLGETCLRLEENADPTAPTRVPWRTQRVGLKQLAKDDTEQSYLARPYRFIAGEGYLKQLDNKEAICRQQNMDADTIRRILGYKPNWL